MEEISKVCYSTTTTTRTTTTTATTTSFTTTTTTTTATTTTITHFSALLLSDLLFFISLILSNPLYFIYILFFSPYLVKLLSFLSPLFITTSLLFLAFLTVSPTLTGKDSPGQFSQLKAAGFLLNAYDRVINTLRSRLDDQTAEPEFRPFEQLEACIQVDHLDYPIDIEVSNTRFEVYEAPIVKFSSDQDLVGVAKELVATHEFLEAADDECDKGITDHNVGDNDTTATKSTDEVEEKVLPLMNIEAKTSTEELDCTDNGGEYMVVAERKEVVNKLSSSLSNLEAYGSMRKGKEWKRTLACKLFEERQNVHGSDQDGMDLLWEDHNESDSRKMIKAAKKKNNKDAVVLKQIVDVKKKSLIHEIKYDDEYEGEDEEDMEYVQMCCLQALKFSTGKMNVGMGRLRFSKALKGFGWLHRKRSAA